MREYSINVEENEKLKAKVTDNEEYITELLEEKTQEEEQMQFIKGVGTGEARGLYPPNFVD